MVYGLNLISPVVIYPSSDDPNETKVRVPMMLPMAVARKNGVAGSLRCPARRLTAS